LSLRKEVLGYYLIILGDDIDNWEINELKEAVTKYKSQENKDEEEEEHHDIEQLERDHVFKKKSHSTLAGMAELETRWPTNTILRQTSLTMINNLNVEVEKYEIEKKNILSKSFVIYTLKSFQTSTEVKRRWRDFFWLRGILVREFPGRLIPPVGKKTKTIQNTDEGFIRRRMIFLQRFLTAICRNVELRSSQAFITFISEPREKFLSKKKDLEIVCCLRDKKLLPGMPVLTFKSIKSFEGDVEVKVNKTYAETSAHYRSLQTKSHELYDKTSKLARQFVKELRETSFTSKLLSESMEELSKIHHNFNIKIDNEKSATSTIESLYSATGRAFKQWSKSFEEIADRAEKGFSQNLKYSLLEVEAFSDVRALA